MQAKEFSDREKSAANVQSEFAVYRFLCVYDFLLRSVYELLASIVIYSDQEKFNIESHRIRIWALTSRIVSCYEMNKRDKQRTNKDKKESYIRR